MEDERHSCGPKTATVTRLLPSHWSRRRSLTVFGLAAGLAWSMAPFVLYGVRGLDVLPAAAVAGPITGLVMAFSLAKVLPQLGRDGTIAVGLLALPIGAYIFSVVLWNIEFFVAGLTHGGISHPGNPIDSGAHALIGLLYVWPATLLATPAAIWTTFQLRGRMETRK